MSVETPRQSNTVELKSEPTIQQNDLTNSYIDDLDSEENNAKANQLTLGKRLLESAQNGNYNDVIESIKEGANPLFKDDKNWDALYWASYYGHSEVH